MKKKKKKLCFSFILCGCIIQWWICGVNFMHKITDHVLSSLFSLLGWSEAREWWPLRWPTVWPLSGLLCVGWDDSLVQGVPGGVPGIRSALDNSVSSIVCLWDVYGRVCVCGCVCVCVCVCVYIPVWGLMLGDGKTRILFNFQTNSTLREQLRTQRPS